MFDEVYCEIPLPGNPKPLKPLFQTKDLECMLSQYIINKKGQLLKDGKQCDYHGMLNFYTFEREGNESFWYEYEAKVTDGLVVRIEVIHVYSMKDGEINKVYYDREANSN